MKNTLKQTTNTPSLWRAMLAHRFSLLEDKASDAEIESRIREGVELVGATPWILMFAIFVASVGLNVNSTAVIIGAMLISPLMGPIMGAGLGVALYDFNLVKRSLFNLAIATVISLLVSTLYFAISPLSQNQSELLARTSPAIWDVLIALFGGLAGIVGATRKAKSNVIPGVAIATALMPPVCTAGFGIATSQWNFVAGALYLYTINCVFIALATIIGIRIMKLKPHSFADAKAAFRMKLGLTILALCTALPSAYLAAKLVQEEVFSARARNFVAQEFTFTGTRAVNTSIDSAGKTIEVSLVGNPINKETLQSIEGRLAVAQLEGAKLIVNQSSDNKVDMTALKSSLLSDLYRDSQIALQKKNEEIQKLQTELNSKNAIFAIAADITKELQVNHPAISQIMIGDGAIFKADGKGDRVVQLSVVSQNALGNDEKQKIESWFKVRTKAEKVSVSFSRVGGENPVRSK